MALTVHHLLTADPRKPPPPINLFQVKISTLQRRQLLQPTWAPARTSKASSGGCELCNKKMATKGLIRRYQG